MFVYILLVIISTIIFISHIYVENEKVNKITTFFWVLLMTVFVGSQDGMGNDYNNYITQINTPWIIPTEPFTILNFYLIRIYNLPVYTIFYVYAFLTYFFLSRSILLTTKSSRFLVLIMIFQTGLFFQSFNVIRQILSCSIYLYGVLLLNTNNRGWKYLIGACLVHYSAVFGILIFLLSRKIRLNAIVFFVFLISLVLLSVGGFVPYIISLIKLVIKFTPYAIYLDSDHLLSNHNVGLGVVYFCTAILCCLVYLSRDYFMSRYGNLLTLFFIGIILYNLLSANVTMQRIVYYPYYVIIVIIPLWVNTVSCSHRSRAALFIYMLFFVFFLSYINSSNCPFVQYRSILFS